MDQDFLEQFRQQLATWIEEHLTEQRLPFQRLETSPGVLTCKGRLSPDIVLWINRDSQLAGSMLLLPTKVDKHFLVDAIAIATTLGLGHFTTWGAREVVIWQIVDSEAEAIHTYSLPPAHQIRPEDFEETLYQLLKELKIVSIETAPSANSFNVYYFINLCLRSLQDLSSGLTDSARFSAGQSADDEWVEQAPVEKAWMSLWRVLFLLWQKRLPPGLQPDRMEQAFHYALADYNESNDYIRWLQYNTDEPPLSESNAVRMHHLSGRLSQLGWPESADHVVELIELLLSEVAHLLNLTRHSLPWPTEDSNLWIGSQPDAIDKAKILVAPRAYLAGMALLSMVKGSATLTLTEKLQELPVPLTTDKALVCLTDLPRLDRKGHEAFLLLLRKVWPNRRFELSYRDPAWIYHALFLAGSGVDTLTMILPQGWQHASGRQILWEALLSRFNLTALSKLNSGAEALCFEKVDNGESQLTDIYRNEWTFNVTPDEWISGPEPTLVWLHATVEINRYLLEQDIICREVPWSDEIMWGVYLYLHTRLGHYLWDICSNRKELPRIENLEEDVRSNGLPLPDETRLQALSLSGSRINRELPTGNLLEKDFSSIFGTYPTPPEINQDLRDDRRRPRKKTSSMVSRIIDKVFLDGIPVFPDHYLMDYYRPELICFECDGPLSIIEEFFDKILLQTSGGQTIEVSGKIHADALILASHSGKTQVSLPSDPDILEKILNKYRSDLNQLWDTLASECRLVDPQKQSAVRLANKIWQQQSLPPKHQL